MSLLLSIAILVLALINPIVGQMGQGSMMGQGGMMGRMAQCEGMMTAGQGNLTFVMMQPMTGACPEGRTCYMVEQFQNVSDVQTRLDCARFWLEKAAELHDLHLRDVTTTTNESQIELMDQITNALKCVTGENVTSYVNNTGASEETLLDEHGH